MLWGWIDIGRQPLNEGGRLNSEPAPIDLYYSSGEVYFTRPSRQAWISLS